MSERKTRAVEDLLDDVEQMMFVEELPRELPYSEVEARCLGRFGPARAFTADEARDAWMARKPVRRGHPSKLYDPGIERFVLDFIGRASLDAIAAKAKARFGNLAPSRSAIARYIAAWRKRQKAGI